MGHVQIDKVHGFSVSALADRTLVHHTILNDDALFHEMFNVILS